MAEQATHNRSVVGSNPTGPTPFYSWVAGMCRQQLFLFRFPRLLILLSLILLLTCFNCCFFGSKSLLEFGTILIAIIALPQMQALLNKPKIILSLIGPSEDRSYIKNENGVTEESFCKKYWHINVEKHEGTLKDAKLVLVAFRERDKEYFVPMLRFTWPYENIQALQPLQPILKQQYIDFFFYDVGNIDNAHLALCAQPNKIKSAFPRNSGDSIDIAIQLIGENYQGKKKWLRITKNQLDWSVSELDE